MHKPLIMLLFIFSHCLPQNIDGTKSSELDILEAVFKHQIDHCYKDRRPKLYFISYKETDPNDALMERLRVHSSFVRKRSEMLAFRDKQTGQPGILLMIGNIKLRSSSAVDVKGSCGAASLDAYSYLYRVVQKKGTWLVKSRRITGVS